MRVLSWILVGVVVSATAAAQSAHEVRNWVVPPFTVSSPGGLTTMSDVTAPRAFVGVQPCRIVDTRGTPGFPPSRPP